MPGLSRTGCRTVAFLLSILLLLHRKQLPHEEQLQRIMSIVDSHLFCSKNAHLQQAIAKNLRPLMSYDDHANQFPGGGAFLPFHPLHWQLLRIPLREKDLTFDSLPITRCISNQTWRLTTAGMIKFHILLVLLSDMARLFY